MRRSFIIPEEMSVGSSIIMLRDHGIVTIPITGYPGAAPNFRLMMHPDRDRLGLNAIERAIEEVVDIPQDPDQVRSLILVPD